MIGRHADVSRSTLDHLQYCVEDANDGPEGPVLALVETPQTIEVAEQLVRSVDEVDFQRWLQDRVVCLF